MKRSRYVILVTLAWLATAGAACTQKAADEALDATREGTATAIEETKEAGQQVVEATGDAAERAVDKTKEIAGRTADKATDIAGNIVSTTGEAITDSWITTKVKAKFIDETELKDSSISVDTDNRVVTLKGTVGTAVAKSRAEAIASGTEGVTRVVNQLVVS
jgi:hyperosmotically inducible protein